ncbi:MAG: hypothetical protein AAF960_19460 [Bacteroidota bacterium]
MPFSIKTYLLISLCLFFSLYANRIEAVVGNKSTTPSTVEQPISKRQKRKVKRLNRLEVKLAKKAEKKQRKNKFGRLGLLILLGGVISLILTDVLFFLALLAAVVLGVVGIRRDEKKLAATLSLAIPLTFIISATVVGLIAWMNG